mmetsp:Transcript_16875/g.65906  ORF Transcript_16875/g.65906 Transcript_16875/m.65906 type:complete len:389 (-) Transcript_16875:35-1201(-)
MSNDRVLQALPVSTEWDDSFGGYAIDVSAVDAGTFSLTVVLNYVWASSERGSADPAPFCVSSRLHNEFSTCDDERATVVGGDGAVTVSVTGLEMLPDQLEACSSSDAAGRWVKDPGAWSWRPYSCHHRDYSRELAHSCSQATSIDWILFIGDSVTRELSLSLASLFDENETQPSVFSDSFTSLPLRSTFLQWIDVLDDSVDKMTTGPTHRRSQQFIELILGHFNLGESGTSTPLSFTADEHGVSLELPMEAGMPDVFVMNPATAHVLDLQTEESYLEFVDAVLTYTRESCCVGSGGRAPIRCIWYGAPYIVAPAEGSPYATQKRNERFRDITKSRVEANGYRYFDPLPITRAREDATWDGQHYMYGDGSVLSSIAQVLLNDIFRDCAQ